MKLLPSLFLANALADSCSDDIFASYSGSKTLNYGELGIFNKIGDTRNGRPIWKNSGGTMYIYAYLSPSSFNQKSTWRIGKNFNSDRAFWYTDLDGLDCPYQTDGRSVLWKDYYNSAWTDEPLFEITPLETKPTCLEYLYASYTGSRSHVVGELGSFRMIAETANDRPVWKNTASTMYLYSYVFASNNRGWRIGKDYKEAYAYGFSLDHTNWGCPYQTDESSVLWNDYYSGKWQKEPLYKIVKLVNQPCDVKGCSNGCTIVEGNAVCDCSHNPLLRLDAAGTTCVQHCDVANGGCGVTANCHNPTDSSPAYCSCSAPLILDATQKNCVEKCSIANGGCDASAICTNPTTAGGDVVCSCAAGKQFGSDRRTCTSTAEADLHCPTSTCWTYEMVDGNKKCVMKTGSAATDAGCNMYLYCSPSIMDFRWNNAKLLGQNTILNNPQTSCPIETSVGLVGTTTPTGADKMWQHAPASCDSTVTRENVDGKDMIIITKSFEYQGDNDGKNLGSTIFLDDAASVTIEVCCKFLATQSATSDDIAIEAGSEVEGKLDAVGSWDGSLKVEFTDNAYANKKTDAAILGETHYIKVSWTVGTSPLAQKVNWYVDDCAVSDVADASKKVDVIENQCFASVINAINTSPNMLSTSDFKFTFKSFSFNSAGNGSQKITCNINFCLKDNNECATETDKTKLTCSAAEAEKWVKPN